MVSSTHQTGLAGDFCNANVDRQAQDAQRRSTAFGQDLKQVRVILTQDGGHSDDEVGGEVSQTEGERTNRSDGLDTLPRFSKKVRVTHEVNMNQFSACDKLALFREMIRDKSLQGQLAAEITSNLDTFENDEIQNMVTLGCDKLCERGIDPQIAVSTMTSDGLNEIMQDWCDQLGYENGQITINVTRCTKQQIKSIHKKCTRELCRRGIRYRIDVRQLSDRHLLTFFPACYMQLCSRNAAHRIDFKHLDETALVSLAQRIIEALVASSHDIPMDMTNWSAEQLGAHAEKVVTEIRRRAEDKTYADRIRPHRIISFIEQLGAALAARDDKLPSHIMIQGRTRPTLLNMPQELWNEIIECCGPEYQTHKKRTYGQLGFSLRILDSSENDISSHQTKKRRLNSGLGQPATSDCMPNILLKFNGPTKFPSLSFVNRALRENFIAGAFAAHQLGIKIDCTRLALGDTIADVWDELLPQRHLDMVHKVNIELRCSVEQWCQMRDSMYTRLSRLRKIGQGMATRAQVKIRVFLVYPVAQHGQYMDVLPSFFDPAARRDAAKTWFKSHTSVVGHEFDLLQKVACIQEIQILNLKHEASSVSTHELYWSWDVPFLTVQLRTPEGWVTIRPTVIGLDTDSRIHLELEDSKIQDL